jgi:hypothetical protein
MGIIVLPSNESCNDGIDPRKTGETKRKGGDS